MENDLKYMIFRIQNSLFMLSCEYVQYVQCIKYNEIIKLSNEDSSIQGIYSSYGRIATIINLTSMLRTEYVDNKLKQSDTQMLILLSVEPFIGLLVDQIIGIESSEKFVQAEKSTIIITDLVKNIYINNETSEFIMELDVQKILAGLNL